MSIKQIKLTIDRLIPVKLLTKANFILPVGVQTPGSKLISVLKKFHTASLDDQIVINGTRIRSLLEIVSLF